jgi:hypothetical protein
MSRLCTQGGIQASSQSILTKGDQCECASHRPPSLHTDATVMTCCGAEQGSMHTYKTMCLLITAPYLPHSLG